jgi:uncharacterized membrane protein YgdD (TMEM256/DUF423 family)
MTPQKILAISFVLLALAVIAGAFGAHGLAKKIEPAMLDIWNKGNFYHFIHALGFLAVGLMAALNLLPESAQKWSVTLLIFGIIVFSGSLYLLAVTGIKILGAITPFGGVSFIAAWVYLAIQMMKQP